jgi:hypothetical protein
MPTKYDRKETLGAQQDLGSMKTNKHKGISRVDSEIKRPHGWYVRVKFNGENLCKFFSDHKYGNKLSSLLAAIECRDRFEAHLGKPHTDRIIVSNHRKNKSGVIGIRQREYGAFEVAVSVEPRRVQKIVIPINGDKQAAFEKARMARQRLLLKAYASRKINY